MNPEYKSDFSFGFKESNDFSFGGNGVSLNQAVAIFGAVGNGVITESEGRAIASLIDQGIL